MYWFKNIMAYRLTSAVDFSHLESALQPLKYIECTSSQISKFGWVPPLSTSGSLHFEHQGQMLLVAFEETKNLPAAVVKKEMDKRIKALEEKEQRKLKKTEKLAIKDDVIAMLIPRAFSKYQSTELWIDTKQQMIYVNASSSKRAENALALLRKALGSLPVMPVAYNQNPCQVMTDWLAQNNIPNWLELLEEGKLKTFDIDSTATFKKQYMLDEDVKNFITNGAYAVNLSVDWETNLRCTINEDGTISKIKFADEILGQNDEIEKEDIESRFTSDFILMTTTLSNFMTRLTKEFGGVKNE